MEKYNGWTNRETWLVNLHFGETLQDYSGEYYLEGEAVEHNLATLLEDWLDELLEPDLENVSSFIKDYIDFSLIDWNELAEHYITEINENKNRIDD
jgi:hypothetical protein